MNINQYTCEEVDFSVVVERRQRCHLSLLLVLHAG